MGGAGGGGGIGSTLGAVLGSYFGPFGTIAGGTIGGALESGVTGENIGQGAFGGGISGGIGAAMGGFGGLGSAGTSTAGSATSGGLSNFTVPGIGAAGPTSLGSLGTVGGTMGGLTPSMLPGTLARTSDIPFIMGGPAGGTTSNSFNSFLPGANADGFNQQDAFQGILMANLLNPKQQRTKLPIPTTPAIPAARSGGTFKPTLAGALEQQQILKRRQQPLGLSRR